MWLERNFAWSLGLTNFEMQVLIKVLNEEELNAPEEATANKLASTIEKTYEDKTQRTKVKMHPEG